MKKYLATLTSDNIVARQYIKADDMRQAISILALYVKIEAYARIEVKQTEE